MPDDGEDAVQVGTSSTDAEDQVKGYDHPGNPFTASLVSFLIDSFKEPLRGLFRLGAGVLAEELLHAFLDWSLSIFFHSTPYLHLILDIFNDLVLLAICLDFIFRFCLGAARSHLLELRRLIREWGKE